MTRSFTRLRPMAFLPVAVGMLLAGSAGFVQAGDVATLASPGPDTASPAPGETDTDPAQAMLDFTQCMRDHGVEMPDPQIDENGRGFVVAGSASGGEDDDNGPTLSGPDFGDPEIQAANEQCGELLEAAMPPIDPEQQAEMQAQALAFTQCMRDNGVDMPDPQFSTGPGGGMSIGIGGPGEGDGIDPRSEEFQAAQEACGSAFGFGPGADGTDPGASPAATEP